MLEENRFLCLVSIELPFFDIVLVVMCASIAGAGAGAVFVWKIISFVRSFACLIVSYNSLLCIHKMTLSFGFLYVLFSLRHYTSSSWLLFVFSGLGLCFMFRKQLSERAKMKETKKQKERERERRKPLTVCSTFWLHRKDGAATHILPYHQIIWMWFFFRHFVCKSQRCFF